MNNEEKILAVLEKHGEMLEKLNEKIDGMDQRMDRMDQRMDRMEERIDQIDERSQRTALLLEVEYKQKLDLLYDGHKAIMETLTPKERIEEIEADVSVLKIAVRTLSEELKELKKAQ